MPKFGTESVRAGDKISIPAMPTWRAAVASKFAQFYNVSLLNPPPDVNVPVTSASEHLARAIKILPASEVNEAYMRETGFRFPTLVPQGLVKLAQPAENFTPAFVAQQIGKRKMIRVMDVEDQTDEEWPISDWVEYYALAPSSRQRIYNVISLEFTHTKLEHLVQAPEIAKKLDWVKFWPAEFKEPAIQLRGKMSFPKIQHYCLMGVANSYTDFHVDFGGTSVWYHVIRGEKVFLLIPPTEANLKLYEEWISNPKQDDVFFGDIVEAAVCVTVMAGNSLLIPTGWIHAVYTPVDSFVFGGNFLHSYSIKLQLDIAELEGRSKVRRKFKFPFFEETNWFTVENYVERILAEAKRSGAKAGRTSTPPTATANATPTHNNSPFVSLPGTDYPYGAQKPLPGFPSSPYPGVKPEIWAAFQRTGYPPQLFPQWFQQMQMSYGAYGAYGAAPGSNVNMNPEANQVTPTNRTASPAATGSSASSSSSHASTTTKKAKSAGNSASSGSKAKNASSTDSNDSSTSAPASSPSPAHPGSNPHTPHQQHMQQQMQHQQILMQQHQQQMIQQQQLMQRRQVFAKGDPIDDTWLTMWEREGLIALLDWLPAAKELFPLSIYNQPGGPGKAQYYIDVITCFLRGVPLPQLHDYMKLHANDPSPYPPAQLLCKVCALEEPAPGAPDTWLGCDYCGQWWHAACLGLTTEQAEALDNFFCDECRPVAHANRKRAKDFYLWITKVPPHLLNSKYYPGMSAAGMYMHPAHLAAAAAASSHLSSGSLPQNAPNVNLYPPMGAPGFSQLGPNNSQSPFYGAYGGGALPNMPSLPQMQGMPSQGGMPNQGGMSNQGMPNQGGMANMPLPNANPQHQHQHPHLMQQQMQLQHMQQLMSQQQQQQQQNHLHNSNNSNGHPTPTPRQASPPPSNTQNQTVQHIQHSPQNQQSQQHPNQQQNLQNQPRAYHPLPDTTGFSPSPVQLPPQRQASPPLPQPLGYPTQMPSNSRYYPPSNMGPSYPNPNAMSGDHHHHHHHQQLSQQSQHQQHPHQQQSQQSQQQMTDHLALMYQAQQQQHHHQQQQQAHIQSQQHAPRSPPPPPPHSNSPSGSVDASSAIPMPSATSHLMTGPSMDGLVDDSAPFQEGSGPVKRSKLEETSS